MNNLGYRVSSSLFTLHLEGGARRDTYTCEYGDDHLAHTDDNVHPTEFLFFHNVILGFIF